MSRIWPHRNSKSPTHGSQVLRFIIPLTMSGTISTTARSEKSWEFNQTASTGLMARSTRRFQAARVAALASAFCAAGVLAASGVQGSGINVTTYHYDNYRTGWNAGEMSLTPDTVQGIPVHQKADALFFLQAASITQKRNPNEVKEDKKFEIADYVIHYADGTTEKVPIYSEINVDNYKQTGDPIAVSGAQIAWTSPYTEPKTNAVAYSMQWTNPKPDVEISSIDLVQGPDRVGIPALIAITAANSKAAK